MVLPLKSWFTIFNAIDATATARVPNLGAEHPEHANSIILEIVGATTPSWTLDIQGSTNDLSNYTAVDYIQIWQAGAAALANAQLSITDTTRRFYLVPNCPPFLQLIATRTTGTLTVVGCYTSEVFSQWLLTTARGSIFAEGPTASDSAEAGNPVQIGGSVDDTSPAAAGEGDVRRIRATPEGNVIAEIYKDNETVAKAEDAAHSTGEYGFMALGVRDDSPAALLSGTDGDYEPLHIGEVGGLVVGGAVAHDAAVAGNPLLLGGRGTSLASLPAAVAEGDAVNLIANPRGMLIVQLSNTNGVTPDLGARNVDNVSASNTAVPTAALGYLYNGDGSDRQRGVFQTSNYIAASLVSATQNGADRTNYNFKGLAIFVDVTARNGTSTITLQLQKKDGNGNYTAIWTAAAALAAVAVSTYLVYPTAENTEGWTEMANSALGARTYRVIATYGGADTISFDVDLVELPN